MTMRAGPLSVRQPHQAAEAITCATELRTNVAQLGARAPGLAKAQISLVVRLTPQKDMVKWLM
jgi:hypothetical protein